MVTRSGRVQAIDEHVISPLLSQPCVLYAVEVMDVATQAVIASERHGVRFTLVARDGTRTTVTPTSAVVEGFGAFDVRCRLADASPRVVSFLQGKGILGPPERQVRIVERRIVVGQLMTATGTLSERHDRSPDPYRTAPRSPDDAFEASGLVLVDPVSTRRVDRVRWTTVGVVGALVALFMFRQLANGDGYHEQRDCPPGTTFQEYYHSDPYDFCGNERERRMWNIRHEHGEAAGRGTGSCVGNGVTYWSPSEESWRQRLLGR